MKTEINAILVDDEAQCLQNLQHYLQENCPRINIIGTGAHPGYGLVPVAKTRSTAFFARYHA